MHWKTVLSALALATALAPAAGLAHNSEHGKGKPTVQTDKGAVRGYTEDGVARFLGIPFAAPPVGELRWRPPVPPKSWKKTLDATRFGPQCLQSVTLGPFAGPQNANEDCLYLNVFAPERHLKGNAKLPVIVWIYGGGNIDGAADGYDGSKLAGDGKTIVVTMNYRMTLMGFLAHPALDTEGHLFGNYGILDQLAVLKWVKANIAAFGGDRHNVTIGGQSAGSIDAMIALTSPLFKGLFHRAILESGIFNSTALPAAEARGVNFAIAAGCGSGTDAATARCLRALTAQQIFALSGTAQANSVHVTGPIEDGSIILGNTVRQAASGQLHKVPVISGGVRDDGGFGLGVSQWFRPGRTPATVADYDARIAGFNSATFPAGTAALVAARYPLSAYATPMLALRYIASDITMCTKRNDNKVIGSQTTLYAFQFSDRTAPNFFPEMAEFEAGAYHTAELPYLFPGWHGGDQGETHVLNRAQKKLSDEMVSIWSAFAWEGNPNGDGNRPWPRYRPRSDNAGVMDFNLPRARLITDAELAAQHKCDLWDSVLTYHARLP
jgi:para-nitrobenzyl esterase